MRRILVLGALGALLLVPGDAAACSWPTKSEADTTNVAFPDEGATYWVTRYAGVPGAEIVIRGKYPFARYFSFHIYDEALRPIASVADYETEPDGSGGYSTKFTFEAPATGLLAYRVYVSDDPADPAGGVPLPDVSLRAAGSEQDLALGQCEPLPPSTGGAVNDAVKDANYPAEAPRGFQFTSTDPPTTERFYGFDRLVLNPIPSNPVTDAVPRTDGGFASNQHVAYLTTRFGRRDDGRELLVYRFKAPTAPDTRAGEEPGPQFQVRYWSVCQNELATQRFVECIADYESVPDADGYVTLVISDPEDRPANAVEENSVNWVPWGGFYYDGLLIYRHMLPSPDFPEAVQNIPEGTPAAEVMGDYLPQVRYCSKENFESGGAAACLSQ